MTALAPAAGGDRSHRIAVGDAVSFAVALPGQLLTGHGSVVRVNRRGARTHSYEVTSDDGQRIVVFPDEILR